MTVTNAPLWPLWLDPTIKYHFSFSFCFTVTRVIEPASFITNIFVLFLILMFFVYGLLFYVSDLYIKILDVIINFFQFCFYILMFLFNTRNRLLLVFNSTTNTFNSCNSIVKPVNTFLHRVMVSTVGVASQQYCGPNGPTASIFNGIWIKQSGAMVFMFSFDKVSLKKLFPTMNI